MLRTNTYPTPVFFGKQRVYSVGNTDKFDVTWQVKLYE